MTTPTATFTLQRSQRVTVTALADTVFFVPDYVEEFRVQVLPATASNLLCNPEADTAAGTKGELLLKDLGSGAGASAVYTAHGWISLRGVTGNVDVQISAQF
jgi:hypothetical protein